MLKYNDSEFDHFKLHKVKDDSIIIQANRKDESSYYRLTTEGFLMADATKEEAEVFKIVRFKERLSTKMQGINIASWF